MNVRILIPLIFLLGFNAAAQKYQLRPIVIQVLPLGLDMTSKFLSNESGITDTSQVAEYLKERGGKYSTQTVGLNLNVSVYVPVCKKIYAGLTYNVSNSKSDLMYNLESEDKIENEDFYQNYNMGYNKNEYIGCISSYERKFSNIGFGIMYLPNNPMRGLPFIPYFKIGINKINITFSDVEMTNYSYMNDYNTQTFTSISTTKPAEINNFNSWSYSGCLGLNIKINPNIQYTLFEADIARYQMSTDKVSHFSLKTGVTILIGKRK
jgi:hypothetical protein